MRGNLRGKKRTKKRTEHPLGSVIPLRDCPDTQVGISSTSTSSPQEFVSVVDVDESRGMEIKNVSERVTGISSLSK